MRRLRWLVAALAVAALSATVAACGSSGGGSGKPGAIPATQDLSGKQGGTLKVISSGDVDYIDPGAAYYQFTYMLTYPTQRPLYSWKPDDTTQASPDLATAPPKISSDGKTVTVTIRNDVHYSPPVNRAATSADVKYAIERGFKSSVANGYANAYFGPIAGSTNYANGKASDITGIQTPNPTTIVFKLDKPLAGPLVGALSLPLSAPVPQEYAAKYDAKSPSTYGTHQVATGPYMIRNDSSGTLTGYQPGKSIVLVRNPNWRASTDYRKAYLDQIDVDEGNNDTTVASRQILDGSTQISGDFIPPPATLKSIVSGAQKSQLANPPSGGNRYVALNTTIAPFNNINVRKAVLAVFDRTAMRLTRGGAAIGDIATHFIPPGIPGFEQAGGTGATVDFLKNPDGDLALAQSYLKKAGYPSGRYTGGQTLLMVGDTTDPAAKSAQVAQAQFAKLGIKTNLRLVQHDTMYTKFCNVPKAAVVICPNVGWQKDFPDGQSILDPTFNGKNIVPENNSNWPQLNVPSINNAMAKAEQIVDPAQRGQAWGAIDKMIVEQAPAVPWVWDNQPNIRSANVKGVINRATAQWDLDFTSLK